MRYRHKGTGRIYLRLDPCKMRIADSGHLEDGLNPGWVSGVIYMAESNGGGEVYVRSLEDWHDKFELIVSPVSVDIGKCVIT